MLFRYLLQEGGPLTVAAVVAFVGIIISLLTAYLPFFAPWYDALKGPYKALIQLGIGLLVMLGAMGLACLKAVPYMTCDSNGWYLILDLFWYLAIYFAGNQSAYLLFRKLHTEAYYKAVAANKAK